MSTRYRVGETWIFDIGVAEIEHRILSARELEYLIRTGPRAGESGRLNYESTEVAPQVWFVSWQEADKSTVVHLEDFNCGTFLSCLTTPDSALIRIAGRMRRK
jgi:hypothetical protein